MKFGAFLDVNILSYLCWVGVLLFGFYSLPGLEAYVVAKGSLTERIYMGRWVTESNGYVLRVKAKRSHRKKKTKTGRPLLVANTRAPTSESRAG